MTHEHLYRQAQDAQRRLFYGLLTAALVILLLSVQFSPLMGADFAYLLLASWFLLFCSLVAGLMRWTREAAMFRHEYQMHAGSDLVAQSEARRLFHRNRRWVRILARVQALMLVLGLFGNLVFAGQNYLTSLRNPPADMDDSTI